jgi:hypothetical protein
LKIFGGSEIANQFYNLFKKFIYSCSMGKNSETKDYVLVGRRSNKNGMREVRKSHGSQAQKRGQPSSEDQKSYVLTHMRTLDLGQMQQCGWTWIT